MIQVDELGRLVSWTSQVDDLGQRVRWTTRMDYLDGDLDGGARWTS